jgi:hypothetical protein
VARSKKENVMNKRTVVLVLGLLAATLATSAQAQSGRVKVKVPFPFSVSDRSLPAGEYVISALDQKLLLEDAHAGPIAMVLANSISGRAARKTGQVVFQCYASQCFLSEVWAPSQDVGRQLLRSRREAGVAERQSPTYFALLGH